MLGSLFVRPIPRLAPRLRLFCFPYAGVGASAFRPWASLLPADVELFALQPPGREGRHGEAPLTDLDCLVSEVTSEMSAWQDAPFAFFGHSMGAAVAYETARRMSALGMVSPVRLFVSGRRAPSIPDPEPPLHMLPDEAFVAELQRRYNGIPEEVLRHPDLLQILLPALRADIAMLERHVHRAGEPLDCPVSALGGVSDDHVTRAHLEAWRTETSRDLTVRLFPGGHFYLQSARHEVVQYTMTSLLTPAASWEAA